MKTLSTTVDICRLINSAPNRAELINGGEGEIRTLDRAINPILP
jgi:hypothetical protein